jgi:hypothetical protein
MKPNSPFPHPQRIFATCTARVDAFSSLVGWLIGLLVGSFVCWFIGLFVGWLVALLVLSFVGLLVGWLVGFPSINSNRQHRVRSPLTQMVPAHVSSSCLVKRTFSAFFVSSLRTILSLLFLSTFYYLHFVAQSQPQK